MRHHHQLFQKVLIIDVLIIKLGTSVINKIPKSFLCVMHICMYILHICMRHASSSFCHRCRIITDASSSSIIHRRQKKVNEKKTLIALGFFEALAFFRHYSPGADAPARRGMFSESGFKFKPNLDCS